MILENCHTWSVAVTFPPGSVDKAGKERRWAHNDTITVVAESAARAIEMVTAQWPEVKVWTVNHIGSRTILMADMPAPHEPTYVRGTTDGTWIRIGRLDSAGRRSSWARVETIGEPPSSDRSNVVAVELCAGREGDDAHVRLERDNPAFDALLDVIEYAIGNLDGSDGGPTPWDSSN